MVGGHRRAAGDGQRGHHRRRRRGHRCAAGHGAALGTPHRPRSRRARPGNRAGPGSRPGPSNQEKQAMAEGSIEIYETEDRTFPPPPDFAAAAQVGQPVDVRRGRRRLRGLLGRPGPRPPRLGRRLPHHPGVGPALRQVVRRRQAQRLLQLPRPPRRRGQGRQGGLPLGGRARRHPHHHLLGAARRRAALRQRAAAPGPAPGRPHRGVHADDPRAGRHHARLHPHRGGPLGDLRRASRPTPSPTAAPTPRPGWWSPPTPATAAAPPRR